MDQHFTRRLFLEQTLVAGVLGSWVANATGAEEQITGAKVKTKTFTYKKVKGLEIKADVSRADDQLPRHCIVWIHGGALINGHREAIDGRVKRWALDSGHTLVSLDYRLAPETQLPAIISDVEDSLAWIHSEGPRLFHIHPEKIAVAGGSAGGYLTLTAGYRAKPRPAVLLSLWGYGDLVGDWYSKPSPHARHQRTKLSREEAYRQVSGSAVSDSRERKGDGGAFYQYCRQHGAWPQAVSGWNPHTEPEKFYPYMAVKNVTAEYPPTAMIHGTEDTDVPYEQSQMMAVQFKNHGVPDELVTVEGGEHGLAGTEAAKIDAAYAKAFAFVEKRLQS